MNIMDFINEEGLILIPVLYLIGMFIKSIQRVPDKYIPIILLVVGCTFSMTLLGPSTSSLIQGILLAGTTVFGNQVIKQLSPKK